MSATQNAGTGAEESTQAMAFFKSGVVNFAHMLGPKRTEPVFLETPRGLITPAGTWFRTNSEQLRASYANVLAQTRLDELVHRAEVWLQSHRSLALFLVPILLTVMPVVWALALGLTLFLVWMLIAPSLGNRSMARAFEWLGWEPLQVSLYVIVLSLFGANGQYDKLIAGVGWFVAIRWQLLDFLFRPIAKRLFVGLYALPVADQMLRAVIFSEAIRLDSPLEGFPKIARWLESDEEDQE